MPSQETISEQKAASSDSEKKLFSLLPFITMMQVGNPLDGMTGVQRQFFFESILNHMHFQRLENQKRTDALLPRVLPPALLAGAAISREDSLRAENEKKSKDFAAASPMAEKKAAESGGGGGGAGAPGSAGPSGLAIRLLLGNAARENPDAQFSAVYGKRAHEVKHAQDSLALTLDDYARGDEEKAKSALADFKLQLALQDYKADELMAVLLLVIEDHIWFSQEADIGSAKPFGGGIKIRSIVPQRLRETMRESANVRLASVREMLRYYFERHPKEYAAALAAALGITADREEDAIYLQERLASELASIGSFALAQKILSLLKLKKKMDTKKCLMELGYRYDAKGKKLILGKRTCGTPAEAKGIIGLLMGGAKKTAPA